MRRIARQKHSAFAHLFRQARVKGVDGLANNVARAIDAEKLLKEAIKPRHRKHLFGVFVRSQRELVAAAATGCRQTVGVAAPAEL